MDNTTYEVRARIVADVRDFNRNLTTATRNTQNFSDRVTSQVNKIPRAFSSCAANIVKGGMFTIGNKLVNSVTDSVYSIKQELNEATKAWKTFEANMKINGHTTKEISKAKKEMQKYATQTIYSASEMANTYAQLDAVGVKNCGSLVKGFGGLASAAENPKQAMKTLSQQATQAAGRPKIAWQDFKLMLEQSPAGMAAVAKQMGISTSQLVSAVQAGEVKTTDFFNAIEKVGTSDSFTKLATTYKTVDEAMDGLTETITNKLGPAFQTASKYAINSIENITSKVEKLDLSNISKWVKEKKKEIKSALDVAKSALLAIGKVAVAVGKVAINIFGKLASAIKQISKASQNTKIGKFVNELLQNPEKMEKAVGIIAGLFIAFKSYKLISAAVTPLKSFVSSMMSLAQMAIGKIAGNLTATAAAQTAVGASSAGAWKDMLAFGAAVVLIGAGLAIATFAISNLAASMIQLASAGTPAILTFAGMLVALGAIVALASIFSSAFITAGLALAVFGAGLAVVSVAAILISKAISNLTPVFQIVGETITNVTSIISNAIIQILPLLSQLVGAVGETVTKIIAKFSELVSDTLTSIFSGFEKILKNIKGIIKQIGTSISSVFNSIGTAFSKVFDSIAGIVDSVGNSFLKVADATERIISAIAGHVSDPLKAALGVKELKSRCEKLVVSLQSIKNSTEKAKSAVDVMLSEMLKKFDNTSAAVKNKGYQLGKNFASGLISALPNVRSAAALLKSAGSGAGGKTPKATGSGSLKSIQKDRKASLVVFNSPQSFNARGLERNNSTIYSDSIDREATYSRSYSLEVPVAVDGREIARATAKFTDKELKKMNSNGARLRGEF